MAKKGGCFNLATIRKLFHRASQKHKPFPSTLDYVSTFFLAFLGLFRELGCNKGFGKTQRFLKGFKPAVYQRETVHRCPCLTPWTFVTCFSTTLCQSFLGVFCVTKGKGLFLNVPLLFYFPADVVATFGLWTQSLNVYTTQFLIKVFHHLMRSNLFLGFKRNISLWSLGV